MFGIQNAQSLVGIVLILGICWAISERRGAFPWKLALGVLVLQVVLVLVLFGLPPAQAALMGVGRGVEALAGATQQGVQFVFGFLSGAGDQPYAVANGGALFVFAFRVLPVILVICALAALLWHWRILKWITQGFGIVFERTMGLRGPPALATAATVFMGQVEGPIFIRSYLPSLSRSELFMLIAVGMACVSGSTLVAYATILSGVLPNAASHVVIASIISAPAGVLLARILVPRDPALEQGAQLPQGGDKVYESSVDAIIKGTGDGLTIVLNVGATLIVFVAIVALVNAMMGVIPHAPNDPWTVQKLLGYVFTPFAWAMGLPANEAWAGGRLLGEKLVVTEFYAFIHLSQPDMAAALSERSRIIMTYALCGFANVASVGINLAGFSVLVPERRAEIIGMVWKAMMAGFMATMMTGSVIGAMPGMLFAQEAPPAATTVPGATPAANVAE